MSKSNETKLYETAAELLKAADGNISAAAPALAEVLAEDVSMITTVAAMYLGAGGTLNKETRHQPRKMPTAAQKAGALRAERYYVEKMKAKINERIKREALTLLAGAIEQMTRDANQQEPSKRMHVNPADYEQEPSKRAYVANLTGPSPADLEKVIELFTKKEKKKVIGGR